MSSDRISFKQWHRNLTAIYLERYGIYPEQEVQAPNREWFRRKYAGGMPPEYVAGLLRKRGEQSGFLDWI